MLKLLSKPTKAESIYCMIRIPIIDVIVAELLLETMKEEGKKISTMKQKPFIPSNSIMQILKAHDTLFTIQMHYSLVDCVICLLWNIFLSMCPDSVKDKGNPRDWKHWLHKCWKGYPIHLVPVCNNFQCIQYPADRLCMGFFNCF